METTPQNGDRFGINDIEVFKLMAEESPNMIFVNQGGNVIYANKKCIEVMGYTREEFYSASFGFISLIAPESREPVQFAFRQHLAGQELPPYEYVLLTRDGTKINSIITTKLFNYNGTPAILGIITDITHQKQIESALREAKENYRAIFDSLSDAILVTDRNLTIQYTNEACKQLFAGLGITPDAIGKDIIELFPFPSRHTKKEYAEVFESGRILASEAVSKRDGQDIHLQIRKIPVFENGAVTRVLTALRDVSENRMKEKELHSLNLELTRSNRKLKQLTLTDPHTGLYNHRYLSTILQTEFIKTRREGKSLSMLMLDIDYFKSINDVYGHQFGDLVLKQFARELKKNVRRDNCIIRYGGEEFVIILPNTNRAIALFLAQRLLDTINITNFGNEKNVIKLKLSIAVASFPEDGASNASDLIDLADHILLKVKEYGGNRVYTSEDLRHTKYSLSRKNDTKPDIKYMKEKIDRLNKRANQSVIEAVFAFAKAIELKDHYTGEHVERTVFYATRIAEELELSKDEVMLVKQAAILHDLGKVGISEKILLKASKLTSKELKEIRAHPLIGVDIIRPIHLLHNILPMIMYHHERWDGKGYPMGIKGEDIPIGARIISLADTYQALISNRPYRKAFAKKEALKIIKEGSGKHFDPAIVDIFLNIIE